MNDARKIIVATDSEICIRSLSDISHAISACLDADGLILTENDLSREFFDLHSGLAGELFQKFTNYQVRVAIVLLDPGVYGERISELAHEHRSHNLIRFVSSSEEAKSWLRSS